jgi:hypothetical protein
MLEVSQEKEAIRLKDKNKKLAPYKDNEFTNEAPTFLYSHNPIISS